jgi:hypothetical protein
MRDLLTSPGWVDVAIKLPLSDWLELAFFAYCGGLCGSFFALMRIWRGIK